MHPDKQCWFKGEKGGLRRCQGTADAGKLWCHRKHHQTQGIVDETYENTKLPMVLADLVGQYAATPPPAAYMFGGMSMSLTNGIQPFQMQKFTLSNGKFQVEPLSKLVFENNFLPSELSELVGGFATTAEGRVPDEIHGLERSGSASCVIGDTIYVLGGEDSTKYSRIQTAMYSTLTDTWDTTSLPPIPSDCSRRMCSAVPVGISKIYFLGGAYNSRSNEMLLLDLETTPARWTNLVDAQCPRHGFTASCEINGVMYMIGGMQSRDGRWRPVDSVYTYNTKSDRPTWKVLGTRMPVATLSDHNGIVVYDDKIYLFGYNDVYTRETILTVFDPLKETFVQLASHPSERGPMYPFLLNDDHIYVVHGEGRLISKYDVEQDMWEILDVVISSEPRLRFNVVSV
jgi:hypothetical protein